MSPLAAPLALVLPLGAIVTGIVLVAVPVLILMLVWSVVTSMRILFPEQPLPPAPDLAGERLRRSLQSGETVPVRVRDIVAAQRAQAAESAAAPDAPDVPSAPHPFVADLWLRRN